MCSNDSSIWFQNMARKYPDRLGWLFGPRNYKRPRPHIPFALDNDAYICWSRNLPFDLPAWFAMLDKIKTCGLNPLWVLVPDIVADRRGTLDKWKQCAPVARLYGWPLAFAVQDGMTPSDVPEDASIVFVGGTTEWKWRSVAMWTEYFPRVHVGRVRTAKLEACDRLGVESCDGTGWFRESYNGKPARQLEAWLEGRNIQYEFY
jgi:hypothetical protein